MLFFVYLFRVGVPFAFLALWVAALAGVVRWGWGRAMSREGDGPVASPLPWVPAKAGTTVGVGGPARAAGIGGGVPLLRDGRFANRPYDGVLGAAEVRVTEEEVPACAGTTGGGG